jgi:hypothetical protein
LLGNRIHRLIERLISIQNFADVSQFWQELTKKLMTGAKWISSIAIHPGGDNLLVGTFDKKVQWFDLDLSSMPYQVNSNPCLSLFTLNRSSWK